MPVHLWSIVCRSSSTDRVTNQISLFEVFEEITLVSSEAIEAKKGQQVMLPLDFQVITLWSRSDEARGERARSRIVVAPPTGKPLLTHVHEMDLTKTLRLRQTVRFESIPFGGFGSYQFRIQASAPGALSKWRTVKVVPLVVKLGTPA